MWKAIFAYFMEHNGVIQDIRTVNFKNSGQSQHIDICSFHLF